MYNDDFYSFIADRKEQILIRIEKAMGKSIARVQNTQEEEGEFVEEGIFEKESANE